MSSTAVTELPPPAVTAGLVWKVTRWLLAAVAMLLVLHVVRLNTPRDFSIETLRMVIDEFHLDREGNVPSWFSSTLLVGAAALMILIGAGARHRGERLGRHWIAMGAIFVLLSMDESASFHEMLIHPLRRILDLGGVGVFHFTWVVPAIVALAVIGVIYLPFVLA